MNAHALARSGARLVDRVTSGRRQRRAWVREGRAHIEVRGLHRPGTAAAARHVEAALSAVQGVQWAQVNAVAGRVVVFFDPEGVSAGELVDVVEGVEEAHDLHEERFPHDRPEHPADSEPIWRNVLALAGDTVGFVASLFGQVLSAAPLPSEIASLVALAENEPRVRRFLEHHAGITVTDLTLGLANAFAQALGQGPLGLVVDMANRVNVVGELQARKRTWEQREPELTRDRRRIPATALAHEPRPSPLPAGPVERYADRAALASMGAFGLALAVSASPRRAGSVFAAGVPKAARLGRESFAAHLDRVLAERGLLVMDTAVLRRLDRIDTVVLDARAAGAGGSGGDGIDPLAELLVSAARRDGRLAVVAGSRRLPPRLGADRTVPGGRRLAASVRALQSEGRAVLLVSRGATHAALRAADCGIGLCPAEGVVPWGADVLAGDSLAGAIRVVQALPVARRVSSRSTLLALAGSAAGGAWGMVGLAATAGRRAALPVNVAALAAQVSGLVEAAFEGGRPDAVPELRTPWHSMDPDAVLAALGSGLTGLAPAEAARRLRSEAAARRPAPGWSAASSPSRGGHGRAVGLARSVAAELANPLTPVLAAGAGLAAAAGSATDAVLVAAVTGANALLGGVQRLRTEVSIASLMHQDAVDAAVRRGGVPARIPREVLVPGDVVEMQAGDVAAADCRVIAAETCEVDESALTGEPHPVVKLPAAVNIASSVAERSSMLYEGSTIVSGTTVACVVATGADTEVGRSLADAPPAPPSGVEVRLQGLTRMTIPATLVGGAAVTGLSLLGGRSPRKAVSSGVSLAVAAVPEGLPVLANAAQLASARRLSRRGALVRNPRTIEALGRVDTLCFDKTGTLTAGRIALQSVSDGTRDVPVAAIGLGGREVLAAALRASPEGNGEVLRHATDRAVVAGAEAAGVAAGDGLGGWRMLSELPFEPARGFHAVVGTRPGTAGGRARARVSVKGAPETVLPRCETWRSPGGSVPLDALSRRRLDDHVDRMARRGQRVLAVAERPVQARGQIAEGGVAGLELLGFLGLADLVRPTARHAVEELRRAGVAVVMITGDHPSTAEAIAVELGLLDGGRVVTGPEVDAMSEDDLASVLQDVSVFARVTPTHKVRIVRAYEQAGRIVAMTGDGANDAPAIRLAHTGIAIGTRCSPAARTAADLVVADDRIETIVDAIVEGRAMWESVRDALAILLGGNLGEVGFTLAATAVAGEPPLSPRQLLLVNLLTDLVPAMAIALRPPLRRSAEALLHEGPDASLGAALTRQIAVRALATAGGAAGAWGAARLTGRSKRAGTVSLAALVGTQLAQTALLGRGSPLVLVSTAASAAVLVVVVQTPGVSRFFGCTPLGPVGWAIATGATGCATGASVVMSRER